MSFENTRFVIIGAAGGIGSALSRRLKSHGAQPILVGRTAAKLALLGFEARISERPSDNGTLYRVRVGPFGQLDTMNRMRGKLTDNGVDVAVVRTPKTP